MNLFECLRLAFNSLMANKLRSLLTMLGIIIGIGAVITITTLGTSVGKTLNKSFDSMGFNFVEIDVYPRPELDPEEVDVRPDDFFSLDMIHGLVSEYPDRFGWVVMDESVGTGEINNYKDQTIKAEISGVGDGNLDLRTLRIIMGRNITFRDIMEERRSAVVSDVFVRQYFRSGENPIGKTVDFVVNGAESQSFTIVGVYRMKNTDKKLSPNQKEIDLVTNVYIPYKTAISIKGTTEMPFYWTDIVIKSAYEFDESYQILRNYFDEQYKNNPRVRPYYYDPHDDMQVISVVLGIVTGVFTLIAMISLLVGGVGVMNIMLVSIVERTREIGVRKALGAKNNDIRLQFVVEAILICLIGGTIGILIGIGNGLIIDFVANFYINNINPDVKDNISIQIEPSIIAIIGSMLFCTLIGVFFGFYPANKAAKMDPIDALRYD